jgi:hypothetical protein
MNSPIGNQGDVLSDLSGDWFDEHAFHNHFRVTGLTGTQMILDDVRIPIRDPSTGNPYRPTTFARNLRRFLRSIDFVAETDVQGGIIYTTILSE